VFAGGPSRLAYGLGAACAAAACGPVAWSTPHVRIRMREMMRVVGAGVGEARCGWWESMRRGRDDTGAAEARRLARQGGDVPATRNIQVYSLHIFLDSG
jgi:hypothetical protein